MIRLIFFLLLWCLFSFPASAQFYKYIDKDGVVRFTDDISQVPPEQLENIEKYTESKGSQPAAPAPRPALTKPSAGKSSKSMSKEPRKGETEKLDWVEKRKALKKQYKALMKEKDQISKDIEQYTIRYKTRKRKSVSRAKLKELEDQEAKWEKKFKDYEAEKKALEILEKKSSAEKKKGL